VLFIEGVGSRGKSGCFVDVLHSLSPCVFAEVSLHELTQLLSHGIQIIKQTQGFAIICCQDLYAKQYYIYLKIGQFSPLAEESCFSLRQENPTLNTSAARGAFRPVCTQAPPFNILPRLVVRTNWPQLVCMEERAYGKGSSDHQGRSDL
jgi:hypothetical protein